MRGRRDPHGWTSGCAGIDRALIARMKIALGGKPEFCTANAVADGTMHA
jgi:hypothetical protein